MVEDFIPTKLGEIIRIASGQVDPKDAETGQLISVGPDNISVGGGLISDSLKTAKDLGQISGKYAFDSDAILYSKIRPNLNKIALPDFDGICSADMYPIWVRDKQTAERVYVYYVMNSEKFVSDATARSFRTGLPKINRPDLESIEVPLPPLPEQRRIAEILRTWDEALHALTALRTVKADAFTALLQNLIGTDGGAHRNWEMKSLHELATRVRRKNNGGDHPVMTISARSGFLLQSDRYSRNMAGRSVENYTILHQGEFAYNKGNSKTAPQGCIFTLNRPTALVPNVYICFALNDGLNSEFYGHLFSAGALNHQLSRVINSGVRNDGLLNLNAGDFFDCKLPLPPIAEQKAIATALTTAKQELALIDSQIQALTRQKRGLMQKLLTGEWRVKVEEPETSSQTKETTHGR